LFIASYRSAMSLQPHLTDVERLSFCGDVVAIGGFRCPADHPLFVDSGPTSGYLMVFPRTCTVIVPDGGHAVTAGPPSVLFYNRGQAYRRKKIDAVDASDWYMIAPDVVRDVVTRHDVAVSDRDDRLFSFFIGPVSAGAYLAQRRLYTALTRGKPTDSLRVEESVINVLDVVVREACGVYGRRPERRRSRIDGMIEPVKALIAASPSASISLRTLASSAGCSPFQLCRSFHAATGYTMTEYRHALRVRGALDALRETRSDLTAIALNLGYSSHSHFTMAFRRHFGITPSEFRLGRRVTAPEPRRGRLGSDSSHR
jgi:AraC family transcriptional regulator